MAVNQTFSGRWLACMIVPAVTEVCRRQAAHSQVNALVFSAQPFAPPQPGQTKPFGQRRRARWSAQAASSGNRASNWARESGRSCFQRLDMPEHYRNTRATASVCPHILPANMATIRHAALNLIRAIPDKASLKVRRKTVAWDDDYLLNAITQTAP